MTSMSSDEIKDQLENDETPDVFEVRHRPERIPVTKMTDTPHLDDACDDGEHELTRESSGRYVCKHCRLSSQTISTHLRHSTK